MFVYKFKFSKVISFVEISVPGTKMNFPAIKFPSADRLPRTAARIAHYRPSPAPSPSMNLTLSPWILAASRLCT